MQPFLKMQASGNDFVMFFSDDAEDYASIVAQVAPRAAALCHRRFGIGGDGVVVVNFPASLEALAEAGGVVRCAIFNCDGSRAANCGNALRCIGVQFAAKYGRDSQADPFPYVVDTGARRIPCSVSGTTVTIDMGVATVGVANGPWHASVLARVAALASERNLALGRVWTANTGNNHVIVEFPTTLPGDADFHALGAGLQTGTELDGINVHLVRARAASVEELAALAALSRGAVATVWETLVWERGAGPTLACGTGACAIASAVNSGGLPGPCVWEGLAMPGGLLCARLTADSNPPDARVALVGSAALVFRGQFTC